MINLATEHPYSFAIIADPQLEGTQEYYDDWENNPKPIYRMYYQTIKAINALKPAFVVINGDLINKSYYPSQYHNFVRLTNLFQIPVLLVHGNHDSQAPFTPFLTAQQAISGFQSMYYSFDAGNWHYIALPSLSKEDNPEAMLNWLASDLQANQAKPTVVFSHFHYLPQGLTQLEYYAQNPIELRSKILDEVLQYGNVKYWFNGHVHNGIQASVKTAWEYRGCKFITVPTTVLPRNFGEEYPAFKQGLEKGGYFMTVNIDSHKTTLIGHQAEQNDVLIYPDRFRSFHPDLEPRWLNTIPNSSSLPFTNGSFEQGLQGWNKVWRYRADHQPGFITQTTQNPKLADGHILELAVQEKGQYWTNDELTEVYQVIDVPAEQAPLLRLNYYINQMSTVGGGYIRLHAYQDSTHQFTMIFYVGHNGKSDWLSNTGQVFQLTATGQDGALDRLIVPKKVMFWKLHQSSNRWHHLQIDVKSLYQKASQLIGATQPFQVNKLFLALGAWNGKIPNSQTRLFFDQVSLNWQGTASDSLIDGSHLAIHKTIYQGRFNLTRRGRERIKRIHQNKSDSADFENIDLLNLPEDSQNSDRIPANHVVSAKGGRSHNLDILTGMDGANTFVLDNLTPPKAHASHSPNPNLDRFSLITHFTPGIDKITTPDAFANYRFVSGYFGFGASTLKDTQIFHRTEGNKLGELLAVIPDVSPLSASDFLAGRDFI